MSKDKLAGFTLVEVVLTVVLVSGVMMMVALYARNLSRLLFTNEIESFITLLESKRLEAQVYPVQLVCSNRTVMSEVQLVFTFAHHDCVGGTTFPKNSTSTFRLSGQTEQVILISPHGILSIE
jgi:Tfp pilus assembly protein PilV